jgi:hypothetical protein
MNWLMLLNNVILHTQLNIEFNDRNLYWFNYNVCKHQNVSGICVRDIIKGRIHLR